MHKKIAIVLLQYLYFLLGMLVMTFGVYLTILAKGLGVSPWDVLHLGLSNYLPLSLGAISQLVGVAVIIGSLCLGIKPKIGTVLNMYTGGVILNMFLDHSVVPSPQNTPMSLIYLFIGIILTGFGAAMYITANLGAGPRDSLMLGLYKKTGFRVSVVRTFTEIMAVISGYLLGGPFGIGTIIFSVSIGPVVEAGLNIIKHFQKRVLFRKLAIYLSAPSTVQQ